MNSNDYLENNTNMNSDDDLDMDSSIDMDSDDDLGSYSADEYDNLYKTIKETDWNNARKLITSNHSRRYIEYIDDEAYSSLHLACLYDAPPDIIKSIVSVSSETALQQDVYGLTPLRISLQFASDELIMTMIKACPNAAYIIDDNRSTPLHDAVLYNKSLGVFRELLTVNPSAMSLVDENQDTPLKMFFSKWDLGLQSVLNPLKNDRLVIPDVDILEDNYGSDKCESRNIYMIYAITLLLLQANQKGTIHGSSPMSPFDAASLALVNPECPWSFFNMMIKIHPEAVYDHDNDGNYLLHIAVLMAKSYSDKEDANTIISKIIFVKDLACLCNKDHKLPLHLAIEQGSSLQDEITQVIFDADPRSLETRDLSTHLYPFALSAVNRNRDFKMSKEDVYKMILQQLTASYSLLMQSPALVLANATKRGLKRKHSDVNIPQDK